eukprot:TRINITY_DN528_c0_g1_i1.p1 TRINITY_DN528_c0_g1~~TRINITY_DN528_c0_g1_i1.p1  ORF type:complete len:201 (-),score=16.27 TRINITY_DN528_c0_g1_i1:402-1004(-)
MPKPPAGGTNFLGAGRNSSSLSRSTVGSTNVVLESSITLFSIKLFLRLTKAFAGFLVLGGSAGLFSRSFLKVSNRGSFENISSGSGGKSLGAGGALMSSSSVIPIPAPKTPCIWSSLDCLESCIPVTFKYVSSSNFTGSKLSFLPKLSSKATSGSGCGSRSLDGTGGILLRVVGVSRRYGVCLGFGGGFCFGVGAGGIYS